MAEKPACCSRELLITQPPYPRSKPKPCVEKENNYYLAALCSTNAAVLSYELHEVRHSRAHHCPLFTSARAHFNLHGSYVGSHIIFLNQWCVSTPVLRGVSDGMESIQIWVINVVVDEDVSGYSRMSVTSHQYLPHGDIHRQLLHTPAFITRLLRKDG